MRIAFANDHAGASMRAVLLDELRKRGMEVLDFGSDSTQSVDYPDCAEVACQAVLDGKADRAVLVCGTGVGICIAANKIKGIRCALCFDDFSARMSREHNDANALALRAREFDPEVNRRILGLWLETAFSGGERHLNRIRKIHALEDRS